MESSLPLARDAIQSARNHTDDQTVREQLASIDEALAGMTSENRLEADSVEGARLEELERQVVELANDADGVTEAQLEMARDRLDGFRRRYAQNWE